MEFKEACKILTNPETVIINLTTGTVNKKWKKAYDIAVNNLLQSKSLIQTNKSCKDMLKKQNKVINAMAEQLAGIAIWNNEKEEPIILGSVEEVKQYYEKKVEG